MARPRRRARRKINKVALVAIAVAVITIAAPLAAWRLAWSPRSAAAPAPAAASTTTSVTVEPSSPSEHEDEESEEPTSSPSPTPKDSTPSERKVDRPDDDGRAVLAGCQQRVRARDGVITQAKIGVGHWAAHVQAQTDANAQRISPKRMKELFAATRVLGPGDVSRYEGARRTADQRTRSCAAPKDLPGEVRAALNRCSDRLRAQDRVLAAGARGMGDWKSHLEDMRRSKAGHVHNAQAVWLRTWRAAPPNINAFKSAVAGFRAPSC